MSLVDSGGPDAHSTFVAGRFEAVGHVGPLEGGPGGRSCLCRRCRGLWLRTAWTGLQGKLGGLSGTLAPGLSVRELPASLLGLTLVSAAGPCSGACGTSCLLCQNVPNVCPAPS